jgi:tetratricopeptide (TPR) repeat protein
MTADNHRSRPSTAEALRYAASQNEDGLHYYAGWELDKAVAAFTKAAQAAPDNPEYLLNLTRSYARNNNYEAAMRWLGDYLRVETDNDLVSRYEQLFNSALDPVESSLIAHTQELDWSIPYTAKGLQMWLEYRIALGRQPLPRHRPDLWAAALTYAVGKVNFLATTSAEIIRRYGVSGRSLKDRYAELLRVLDLMPADYRYYVGEENPLDKLVAVQDQNVAAADMVADLYAHFRDD